MVAPTRSVRDFALASALLAASVHAASIDSNPVTLVEDIVPLSHTHPAFGAEVPDVAVAYVVATPENNNSTAARELEEGNKDIERLEAYFNTKMTINFRELQKDQYKKGAMATAPWPSSYWPIYQDGINARWDVNEDSPAIKYARAFGLDVKTFTTQISESTGVLSQKRRQECAETRDCTSLNDGSFCGKREGETNGYCIPGWFGICHAWAPASFLEVEPKCPVQRGDVTFQPMDIKALMTQVYDGVYVETVFTAARFNGPNDPAELDDYGRYTNPARRDLGPGFFHIAVTNIMGRFKKGFIVDVAASAEVWNQPVRGFEVVEMKEVDEKPTSQYYFGKKEYPFNSKMKYLAYVKMRFSWIVESLENGPLVATGRVDAYTQSATYEYLLELDRNRNIIGGEWVGESRYNHPDFLWFPTKKPSANSVTATGIKYSNVQQLVQQSLKCEPIPTPAPSTPAPSSDVPATTTPAPSSDVPATTTPAPSSDVPATTTPAPSSDVPATTTPAPSSDVPATTTPAPSSDVPATTTPAPSSDVPATTTPAPSSDVPATTTPAPSSDVPATTTPAPSSDVPATTTPAPSSDVPATTTPAPSSDVPATTTPAPSSDVPATTTPAPSSDVPATTTPAPSSDVPATTTPAPSSDVPATTTPAPSSDVPATTTPAPSSDVPATTTPAPSSDVPATTTPAPSSDVPATTTPAPSSDVPATTTPAPSSDVPATTTPAPSSDVPATTTPAPPSDVPATTTPAPPSDVPATTTPAPSSDVPATTTPAPSSDVPAITTSAPSSDVPATTTPAPSSDVPASTTPCPSSNVPISTTQTPIPLTQTPSTNAPTPSSQAMCGKTQVGIDFYGDDLRQVPNSRQSDCCDLCAKTLGCKAYTFARGTCYLKYGHGTRRPHMDAVSAVLKHSGPTPSPDYSQNQQPVPAVCQTGIGGQCGNEASGAGCCPTGAYCQAWNPWYYQCRASPARCPKQQIDVDFYGGDLKVLYGLLPNECCDVCAQTKKCVAYTFVNYNYDGRSACYLKKSTGKPRYKAGAVSATVQASVQQW